MSAPLTLIGEYVCLHSFLYENGPGTLSMLLVSVQKHIQRFIGSEYETSAV